MIICMYGSARGSSPVVLNVILANSFKFSYRGWAVGVTLHGV